MSFLSGTEQVRAAAVAGMFYPGDRSELLRELGEMLEEAREAPLAPGFPKVLIVPHAGYIYSGPVAASGYDRLRPARGIVTRVVLLGPCHQVPVRGMALPGASAFDTPLGRVRIDLEAVTAIRDLPQVVEQPEAHAGEHALEVQLPFLQAVLGDFALLPLVVGQADPENVAQVLERLWGGSETLVVISTDLSHYLSYDEARVIDSATANAILGRDEHISHHQACGATPLAGALLAARRHGLSASLLDLRNSGDTAGGHGRVVGYGSFALQEGERRYGPEQGRMLLSLARGAIGAELGLAAPPPAPADSWLRELRATFVTLALDEKLRGCIGALEAYRPLAQDVMDNARDAAMRDPRFSPLTREEFARLQVEVSLLSTPKRIVFGDHADLIRQMRRGEDGIILQCNGSRATFLPQVWETLPEPEQFLSQLKLKAGIPADTSTSRCRVLRYSVLKWREKEFAA